MSPEEFEKQLQQRPMRPIPANWQSEILGAAKAAASASSAPEEKSSIWSIIRRSLLPLLELRPKALASLAAVWVLILVLHFSTHDDLSSGTGKTVMSQAVLAEVREQRLFFAELAGLHESQNAEPPKRLLPGPRSEWRQVVTA